MKIRKIIIFCLIAILCMGLSTNIFANEEVLKPVEPPSEKVMERATVKVYDEYDMYNSLQQQSPAALQAKGYTQQDIQSIKSTTYESLLRERGKLSTDELKNYGYSDAQIAILKNPNSTDAELRSASSKITVTTVVEKLEHLKDNYTYSTVYLEWMWKTIPTSRYTDSAAIAWTGEMAFMPYSENNKSRYTLWKRNLATKAEAMKTTPLTSNHYVQLGRAVQIPEFHLSERASGATSPVGPSGSYNVTFKGAARIALKYYGTLSFMQAQGAYAHYSIGVSGISISLSWPPSISINFSKSPYAVYRANDSCTVTER